MKFSLSTSRRRQAISLSAGLLSLAICLAAHAHNLRRTSSLRLSEQADAGKTQMLTRMKHSKLRQQEEAATRDELLVAAQASRAEAERLRSDQREASSRLAIENYKKASDLWRKANQLARAAGALRDAGEIYQTLGDAPLALVDYKQSLSLSRKARNLLEESKVLNDLGYLYFLLGNNAEALRSCSMARRLAAVIGNREVEAQAISCIGDTFYSSGDLAKALEYQQNALGLWRSVGNQRGQAHASVALGYDYMNLGEPQKALESYQQALSLSRDEGDLRGQALAHIAIGNLKSKLGEKQEALDSYNVARVLVERLGDRTSLATVLGGMGYIYYGLGDIENALSHSDQALKLFELTDQKWGIAEAKLDLGRMHHSLGKEQKALDCLHEALALFKTLSMPRLEAQTLRDIGLVYSSVDNQEEALNSYKQALKLTRMGQDQRQEAYTLNYLGRVYETSGDKAKALLCYRRALPLNHVAADPAGESLTLHNLAHIERDRGNFAEALRQIEAAIKIAESLRTKVFSQDLRASYFATVRQNYELYMDVLMRLHKERPNEGFDARAFAISEKARARSFLESLQEARANIRRDVSPELLAREHSLEEVLNIKAERQMQLLAKKHKEEAEKIAGEIGKLTGELAEVQDRIRATSPRYAALTLSQPLGLREVQQQVLDNDSLLIEYALGDERSYVWAVTRSDVRSFELPPRAEIEAAARSLYELFTSYQLISGEPIEQRRQRETKADEILPSKIESLSKLVLGPLVGKLGSKRLLIVPDGALQYIPFQVLTIPEKVANGDQTPEAEWKYSLLRNHEIVNELSASTLALLLQESTKRQPAADSVAVLADPVFEVDDPRLGLAKSNGAEQPEESLELRKALRDERDAGISPDGVQIPRLLASREEAEGIVAAVPRGTGLKFLDFDASRAKVLGSELGKYRIVHFATHGLINNEHPELSGIVLSLFDRQGNSQNGFLRMHDIYNLHLPVDLVVLSACSTGLGKDIKGEGLIGLTRGFMYAGAAGVVASLWKVDDDATAELMRYFYEGMFKKGLSPAAALRDSQLAMSQQKRWQSPYYWAGFVIQGQYSENENFGRPSFLTGQRVTILCVLAAALLLTSLFFFHRRRSRII
jgi:CHAT domain-containing protein